MTAQEAIARSISHNEIVHVDYDLGTAEDLMVLCEDHTTGNDEEEYWGVDDDGATWRVHMAVDG